MLRLDFIEKIEQNFRTAKAVAILGPRQCGKTTIARSYFSKLNGKMSQYFDLENPRDLSRITNDPVLALESFEGLIVIDEIQLAPELFKTLRYLIDRPDLNQQYLILGSASRELIQQSSQSLAGRINYLELSPFNIREVDDYQKLWLRGGFPLSYLAPSNKDSNLWRSNYIKTYLEQDIPKLGINIPAQNLRRFWMMITACHGQVFNASKIGNSLGVSHNTARKYLDILSGTFMVRELTPWYENIKKRQVKSNKIYFRDTGILHTLLGISEYDELLVNPNIGASWEGFALEAVIDTLNADAHDCYFWAIHNNAELDLLILHKGKKLGFEIKYTTNLKITKSMRTAINDLNLDKLFIIYPGSHITKLESDIYGVGLNDISNIEV